MSGEEVPRCQTAFFCDYPENVERVYGCGRRQRIEAISQCRPTLVDAANFDAAAASLGEVEAIFSTWGMPKLTPAQLARMPALRAVFYAAGSVQDFARPFLERGVAVISAGAANAIPVAEFTLAQILLANKGYFRNQQDYQNGREPAFVGRGNFDTTIALLGAGAIGKKVVELLRPYALKIIVFDPFLPEPEARRLNVALVSLEEAFRRGDVVSNHLANLPATVGLLQRAHFEVMPPQATFINTGRAATAVQADLVAVLQERSDLTALLDVFDPPANGLAFPPNLHCSTHIAGSGGNEVVRMADYVIEDFSAWRRGEPLRSAVTLAMLETMA